jgi:hypothetical protein
MDFIRDSVPAARMRAYFCPDRALARDRLGETEEELVDVRLARAEVAR